MEERIRRSKRLSSHGKREHNVMTKKKIGLKPNLLRFGNIIMISIKWPRQTASNRTFFSLIFIALWKLARMIVIFSEESKRRTSGSHLHKFQLYLYFLSGQAHLRYIVFSFSKYLSVSFIHTACKTHNSSVIAPKKFLLAIVHFFSTVIIIMMTRMRTIIIT